MKREEIEGLLDRLAYIFTSQEEERKIKAKLLAYVEELERKLESDKQILGSMDKVNNELLTYNLRLKKVMRAGIAALKSYQYGNSSPDLAEEVVNAMEQALAEFEKEK